jgi:hypothetical protein
MADMSGYSAWAKGLFARRPRLGGLLLAGIGAVSSAAQLALVRGQGRMFLYSRAGVFLAPFCLSMGLWFALVGRPFPRGAKPPFWYKAGLAVLLVATLAFSASIVAHPERLTLKSW